MSFQPSLVRQALDELLRLYPMFDLVSVDWQLSRELYAASTPQRRWNADMIGPWVLVNLGQASETSRFDPLRAMAWAVWPFAIWKQTGALYAIGSDGAVPDDPIWTP